jgi:signal transduction histidine kinase
LLPDRMQQVFLNLVLNAVDAMLDGGQLQVSTALCAEPRSVQIQVTDQGVGIPTSEIDHLFDPFYTTKSLGMGLGLYVSQGIVQNHGGRIAVKSQVGEGTTFTVWLPA